MIVLLVLFALVHIPGAAATDFDITLAYPSLHNPLAAFLPKQTAVDPPALDPLVGLYLMSPNCRNFPAAGSSAPCVQHAYYDCYPTEGTPQGCSFNRAPGLCPSGSSGDCWRVLDIHNSHNAAVPTFLQFDATGFPTPAVQPAYSPIDYVGAAYAAVGHEMFIFGGGRDRTCPDGVWNDTCVKTDPKTHVLNKVMVFNGTTFRDATVGTLAQRVYATAVSVRQSVYSIPAGCRDPLHAQLPQLQDLVDVIYLFGGYYNGALKRMDIYLPSVGVFCPAGSAADMPYALYSMDAGALPYRQHHYIYVAGGLKTPNTTSPDGAFSSQTLAYDPFSEGMDTSQYHIGKWTILNGQQYSGQYYPRAYAGAVTVGCEMYILGGQRVVNGSISDKVTNDVQVLGTEHAGNVKGSTVSYSILKDSIAQDASHFAIVSLDKFANYERQALAVGGVRSDSSCSDSDCDAVSQVFVYRNCAEGQTIAEGVCSTDACSPGFGPPMPGSCSESCPTANRCDGGCNGEAGVCQGTPVPSPPVAKTCRGIGAHTGAAYDAWCTKNCPNCPSSDTTQCPVSCSDYCLCDTPAPSPPFDDTCKCNAGFTGLGCDECANDHYLAVDCVQCTGLYFGKDCAETCAAQTVNQWGETVACNGHGVCHSGLQGTGVCNCDVQWNNSASGICDICSGKYTTNSSCTECEFGYELSSHCTRCEAGFDITKNCQSCAANYDIKTNCTTCVGNFGKDTGCTNCLPGYHGADCNSTCPGGVGMAACNGATHGTCSDGISGTGKCSCLTGVSGDTCNACEVGYFCSSDAGANSPYEKSDYPVSCHGLDANGTTSVCSRCVCQEICPEAAKCSGHGTCDTANQCECNTHFNLSIGCSDCDSGLFGASCGKVCPGGAGGDACSGSTHGTCFAGYDKNGTCACASDYTGASCSQKVIGPSASPTSSPTAAAAAAAGGGMIIGIVIGACVMIAVGGAVGFGIWYCRRRKVHRADLKEKLLTDADSDQYTLMEDDIQDADL